MDTDCSPTVSLTDLTYRYDPADPDSQVLNSISLNLCRGELIILTGASGSGKTTLLTLIGGLRSGATGRLEVLGNDLISATIADMLDLRRQVGFIFQSHNLLPYLTASENIQIGLEIHDSWRRKGITEMQDRCIDLLRLLELESKASFKPKNLSLGQKQRISIARAIANSPDLILADEPTASLDKESARIAVTLLKDLTRLNQTTVLVVTHDHKIIDYADRVVNLENGIIS
jgi:putative ABC transport system ATP-binding protein